MDVNPATLPPPLPPQLDPSHSTDVTALADKTAILNCRVHNIANKTVSWIRHRDIHLLTVGRYTYTSDQRFRALHEDDSDDWVLKINYVQPHTHILGGPDMYINKGSTINLTCVVEFSPEPPDFIYWNHNNKIISYDSTRGGVTVIIEKGDVTTSSLLIQKAQPSDSGRYDCNPSNASPANVTVHVLNVKRRTPGSDATWRTRDLHFLLPQEYSLPLGCSSGTPHPSAVVATKPSAVVATKPSAVVATKPAGVATKPSAVVVTKPSAVVATKPSAVVATKPSAVVATKPSAVVATKPSAVVATKPSAVVVTQTFCSSGHKTFCSSGHKIFCSSVGTRQVATPSAVVDLKTILCSNASTHTHTHTQTHTEKKKDEGEKGKEEKKKKKKKEAKKNKNKRSKKNKNKKKDIEHK
ncbi:putative Immunoglobulin domain-containing protein 4, partial [Homarus americanus]